MAKIYSTKTYDHNEGLSCAFRQWRASHSHCHFLHGYALRFRFVFASLKLNETNWVFDFGGLKPVKQWLKDQFDHTTCVAADDPDLETFKELHEKGIIDLRILERGVGCERTAEYVGNYVDAWVRKETNQRVWLHSAEVSEHEGNSAIWENEK